jgi:hypothetical protein
MTSAVGAPGRRARGLLLAVLLAAAQGSAWLHAAVVAHVTCLEHGESIHAAVASSHDADPRDEGPDANRLTGAEAGVAAHDHCAGGALLRWRDVALAAPASSGSPVASVTATLDGQPFGTGAASALYRLAPKTSPPRAAV